LKVTTEDLRRQYASLPDAELLSLHRGDLTDAARPCYDQELARRGLVNTAAPERPGPEGEGEVAVAAFSNANDARLARSALQAAGIPCYLENEHAAAWSAGPEGIRLMAPAGQADVAARLLGDGMTQAEADMPSEPWDGAIEHRFVETNGIRMHYAEAGSGPLVVLCHGFPESWYSWRHQLPALATEGYHVVAPDLRGYGQTDRPEALEAYDILQLTGDLVGLVNALGEAPAVIVGHDWGAWLAQHAALLRPDLFRAVVLMGVPYVLRRSVNQSQWEAQKYPGKLFYQAALRSPGAEQFFEADVRASLLAGFWSLSGDAPPGRQWQPVRDPAAAPVAAPVAPAGLPPWLAPEDLDFLEAEYTRTGFTGGLNYYRNCDRNWALTPFLDGAQLLQPTLFLTGEKDPALEFLDEEFEVLEANVPNLWKKVVLEGAGHWIQQERAEQVNGLLIGFLNSLDAGVPDE
jgi:pimeloyl-ACP methyl ester carboxylesterase